jgi:hypothetical protein
MTLTERKCRHRCRRVLTDARKPAQICHVVWDASTKLIGADRGSGMKP